ncbi:MAG: hypothetical protein MJA30_27345 [Cytophagales bacterium]|nr:hypothetical protein [Cytophagales bacterium]
MNKGLLSLSLALCIIFNLQAQQGPRNCAAEEVLKNKIKILSLPKEESLLNKERPSF